MKNANVKIRERAFPIVIVGHIDHGKSTLIGRMLYDTGSLPTGKVEELQASCDRRNAPFEWSFVLDALQLERDQAITVDSTQIWFHTETRRYVIIDAPGHREFLRNMVTGAASANAGVIVIDAEQGVSEQTRRHAYLLHLIGIPQVVVAVNKMDLVNYSQERFQAVEAEMKAYLKEIELKAQVMIPVAAMHGDNLGLRSTNMPWYSGPTLIDAIDDFPRAVVATERPFRMPVQDVYRQDGRRLIVGRVESGQLELGSAITVWPTGRSADVVEIKQWAAAKDAKSITTGESVALTLNDELFIERGHVLTVPTARPRSSNSLSVRLFWLSSDPLRQGESLTLKLATAEYDVTIDSIDTVIDVSDLSRHRGTQVPQNGIAEVTLRSRSTITYELFHDLPALGRAVLLDGYDVVGGCIIEGGQDIEIASRNLTAVTQSVKAEERQATNGYPGAVLWMSGLSGAGKSTLAMALQRELFNRGLQVYTLDGDNVRNGLNSDLGFSEEERAENIRRVAEVSKLFSDAGTIVISAFIAPTNAARAQARDIIGDQFHEVYISADMSVCESRDAKGLYAKARSGEINDFTGISSPWEPPENPDLEINTGELTLNESLDRIVTYIEGKILIAKDKALDPSEK
ncbi:MAG: adenylyl-sulfate kinase [Rhodospirillaceae bacterium]|nr:adenylyl-sulfate kinase [Rhodospirillaceae bacterium]